VFVLALALAPIFGWIIGVQAVRRAPIQQPNDIVIKLREACGAGTTRVNGVCKNARQHAVCRCATGMPVS
jgi:hypothetical protein